MYSCFVGWQGESRGVVVGSGRRVVVWSVSKQAMSRSKREPKFQDLFRVEAKAHEIEVRRFAPIYSHVRCCSPHCTTVPRYFTGNRHFTQCLLLLLLQLAQCALYLTPSNSPLLNTTLVRDGGCRMTYSGLWKGCIAAEGGGQAGTRVEAS